MLSWRQQPVKSPREAFKEAFASGLVSDGETWMDMIDDRNLTSHTYQEGIAKVILSRIEERYIATFGSLSETVRKGLE